METSIWSKRSRPVWSGSFIKRRRAPAWSTTCTRRIDRRRKRPRCFGGAYHFGTAGDGAAQADFFLSKATPDAQTLLVLDYEPNGNSTMTLDQARAFVQRIQDQTGRYPGLYSGSLIKQQLGSKPPDPILYKCFLWIAQYGQAPTQIPATRT